MSAEEGAAKAVELIKELSARISIPAGLKELGVREEDFPILTENALKDACGLTNPQQATAEEITAIFAAAM